MKSLVVWLLVTVALGDAAPSDFLPGDIPAPTSPELTGAIGNAAPSRIVPGDIPAPTSPELTGAFGNAAPSRIVPGDTPAPTSPELTGAFGNAAPSRIVPGDTFGNAAPSRIFPGDLPAAPQNASLGDVHPRNTTLSGLSSSSSSTPVKTDSAALPYEKIEHAAGAAPAPAATPVDEDKIKVERPDKEDVPVEAAEPSGQDIDTNSPVKKVPVFVPVEIVGAFQPDNFFNSYPVTSGLGGYPPRSVVNPWYHLVSPEVPIVTLYPGDPDDSIRGSVMTCDEPSTRYIHGANPMLYGGPSAASPYAANQFAAASLAGNPMGYGVNPNPYGNQAPYYRVSYVLDPTSLVTSSSSVDYSRSTLITPTSRVSPISSVNPLIQFTPLSTISPVYPDAPHFNPYIYKSYPLAPIRSYTTNGRLIHA